MSISLKLVKYASFGLIEPCYYLDELIETYVFHADHRTKEQLGYVVESGPRMTYRVLGYCFRIQSSKYSSLYLHDRINNFINGLQDLLVLY